MITRLLAAFAFAFLLAIGAAYAADPSTAIDIAPLVRETLLPIASAVGLVLATWLGKKLADLLGVQREDKLAGKLEEAMKNGLAFAQARLERKIGDGPILIDVKREIVAEAAKYAVEQVPGTLKALSVTPDQLANKLTARLELNTTPPERSIAVPTPPAS